MALANAGRFSNRGWTEDISLKKSVFPGSDCCDEVVYLGAKLLSLLAQLVSGLVEDLLHSIQTCLHCCTCLSRSLRCSPSPGKASVSVVIVSRYLLISSTCLNHSSYSCRGLGFVLLRQDLCVVFVKRCRWSESSESAETSLTLRFVAAMARCFEADGWVKSKDYGEENLEGVS